MQRKKLINLGIILWLVTAFSINVQGQIPANYYDGTEGLEEDALKAVLNDIIKGHTVYTYTSTLTDTWDILKVSDADPSNPSNVILVYSGKSVDGAQEYNSGSGWTREHAWPTSRGDFGTTRGTGTDLHNLKPCDVSVNSARNNRWFDYADTYYYDDGVNTGSLTSYIDFVWEPRDEVKGDIARMVFYMATRYEGEDGELDLEIVNYFPPDDSSEPLMSLLQTLKEWHEMDPVDDFERNRNDVIYSYQNNRNPFIDHPEFVEKIWGPACETTAIGSYESYYTNIDRTATGEQLRTSLHNLITGTYDRLTDAECQEAIKETDFRVCLHEGDVVVSCYNEMRVPVSNYGISETLDDDIKDILKIGGTNFEDTIINELGWNRQSIYPKNTADPSLEITTGATDLHNLRATLSYLTSYRSNKAFGEKETKYDDEFHLVDGNRIYPGDNQKGDIARIIFYMNTFHLDRCPIQKMGSVKMFMKWHEEDPVDDFERIRNDRIYSEQGNRNPFIDYPELAEQIYGKSNYEPFLSKDNNYIHIIMPQISVGDNIPENEEIRSNLDFNEKVMYFDGLGRLNQSIDINLSPLENDIVQYIDYDGFGRKNKTFLPYTILGSGEYRINGESEIYDYYNNQEGIAHSNFPFSEKIFDNSPLNKIMEQGSPGQEWQPQDVSIQNSGHTAKYLYSTNDEVIPRWYINSNKECVIDDDGSYPLNSLYKFGQCDENENWNYEYKDKTGKLILSISYTGNEEFETFYVYDEFDRLVYILPPKAIEAINGTTIPQEVYDELIYVYKYDSKGRIIEKKIPGVKKEVMIYDNRDRLVLTQDGNLSDQDKWSFIKYDVLNRPIITGIIQLEDIEYDELVLAFSNHNVHYEEKDLNSNINYTLNNSYPAIVTVSDNNVLTVTFYDNYTFLSLNDFSGLLFDNVNNIDTYIDKDGNANGYSDRVTGYVTGKIVKILDGYECTSSANKILTVNYYDDKQRVIQSIEKGFENSKILISNQYNFTNQLLATRQINNIYGKEYVIDKEIDYDHAGRLLKVWQTLSGEINKPKVLISEMQYNENGELINKQLHEGLQSIDYQYNIRGWLTNINDPFNLGSDLFGMKLLYNDINEKGVLDGLEQYNGNISGMIWNSRSIASEPIRGYGFSYDEINRLTAADYGEYSTIWTDFETKYNVKNITYDKNSNIMSLMRYGESQAIDDLTYGYENNSNRLNYVNDNSIIDGFTNSGSGTFEYDYDLNGNMIRDDNKGISSIQYNILNLPEFIQKGTDVIEYIYDATGRKLVNNLPSGSYIYIGDFVFNESNSLEYIQMIEGRIYVNNEDAIYEYYLKDHLGNTRVIFDETGTLPKQTSHYYPFGMRFNNASIGNTNNKCLYNGKELQEETDWYDYGARMYDPSLGRFFTMDRFSEKHYPLSPYQYANNNPIFNIDVNGDWFSGATEWIDKIYDYFEYQIAAYQRQIQRNEIRRIEAERVGDSKKANRIENRIQRKENNLAKLDIAYDKVKGEISRMSSSSQEYHINPSFGNEGAVGYDWNTKRVLINFNSRSTNALANFAHELKHGYQFDVGKISLVPNSNAGGDLYDLQDEVEAYQRMQLFGKYTGKNIDANWVMQHAKEAGGYESLISQNRVNQISTTTPVGSYPGAITYGKQIEFQINKAGLSNSVPAQVIINWQLKY